MGIPVAKIISYFSGIYNALKGKPANEVMSPKNQGEFEQFIFEGSKSKMLK